MKSSKWLRGFATNDFEVAAKTRTGLRNLRVRVCVDLSWKLKGFTTDVWKRAPSAQTGNLFFLVVGPSNCGQIYIKNGRGSK